MLSGYQSRHPAPPTRPSPTSQASPYQQPSPSYQNKPPPRKPTQTIPTQTLTRPYNDAYPPTGNYTGRRPPPSSSTNNSTYHSTYNYGASPPPTNYGFGPRPTDPHNRPPPSSRPPPTPAPGPTGGRGMDEDASLFALFQAVDIEGHGQLTERELGSALVNGDFTSFDPYTVRMMIRMFDTDRSGTIAYAEFRYSSPPPLPSSFFPPLPFFSSFTKEAKGQKAKPANA